MAIAEPNQLYLLGTQILYQPVCRGLFAAPMEPVLRVADLAGQLGTECSGRTGPAAGKNGPHLAAP
jgi:hypothetical protein